MTADTITAIKKALEGVTPDAWRYRLKNWGEEYWHHFTKEPRTQEADEIWEPLYTPSSIAVTLESLQRENERMKARLDIGPQGEYAIDVAESAADFLRHRAEMAEAEVKRLRDSQDGLCSWLLHRFGPNTPEGREASWRMSTSAVLSSTGDTHGN